MVRFPSMFRSRWRIKVVLPEPTSPVISVKPAWFCRPYLSIASAIACYLLRKRNSGSGVRAKGLRVRP